MRFPIVAALLMLGAVALVAFGQSEVPEPQGKLLFEGANAIVKYDCTLVVAQSTGHFEQTDHYLVHLLTERGIREHSQDFNFYFLAYDTVEILDARVHLPDGSTVTVSPDDIKDVPLPAFGPFFLENVREKIITFPALRPGAEVEVTSRMIAREPPIDSIYDYNSSFEEEDPIQLKFVQISVPAEMKLKWKSRNGDIPHEEETQGDRVIHRWKVADIPQMIPEPGMPPAQETSRQLFATNMKDWQFMSRWYDNLADSSFIPDDAVKAKVAELTQGKTTEEDKIAAIFYFVSNDIRYVETSLTGRKAGYKPEPAGVTLSNRYGVCRDKAALMVSMLRTAGIPSDIVLTNPVWKIDADIPCDQFNHAIVAIPDEKTGHFRFLDPTVEKTRDYLAPMEQDKAVLPCTERGEALEWLPLMPPEDHLFHIQAQSQLHDNGSFTSEVTISTRGLPDLILRNWLLSIPPEQRENTFKQIIQRVSPTARLEKLEISDLMDFTQYVKLTLAFSATDYSVAAGNYLLFEVPNQASGLDFLTPWLLRGSDLTTRHYPLQVPSTFAVRADEEVSFPKGYAMKSLPDPTDLDYKDFRLARKFEVDGNQVKMQRLMEMSVLDIPLTEYPKLQAMMKEDDVMSKGRVILKKSS
jgi:hypothetical protein